MPQPFQILRYTGGVVFEDADISVIGLAPNATIDCRQGTIFVAVAHGRLATGGFLSPNSLPYEIGSGMYGCLRTPIRLTTDEEGWALVATVKRYTGIFALGGPLEDEGRLRYIDGCTDTGLIQPLRRGDPCLNYLHFPANTLQTAHYHPSHRIGLVYGGEGQCHHGERPNHTSTPMRAGDLFVIPAGTWHWFETDADHVLRVIAFHPDSDFGPTDESHQMLDATLGREGFDFAGLQRLRQAGEGPY